MNKFITAAMLATGLMLAPLPIFVTGSIGQSVQPTRPTVENTNAKKPSSSPSQVALRERQRKCGAEWREAKKARKVEKGMKWPQFWSACNKRLKAGS